jgi:hypothetical protein
MTYILIVIVVKINFVFLNFVFLLQCVILETDVRDMEKQELSTPHNDLKNTQLMTILKIFYPMITNIMSDFSALSRNMKAYGKTNSS